MFPDYFSFSYDYGQTSKICDAGGNSGCICVVIKDVLSGLRQYLANENSLKMMKNAFYFTLKAFLVLKKFMS